MTADSVLPTQWQEPWQRQRRYLLDHVGQYLSAEAVNNIGRGADFACLAHHEQYRKSGEPYVFHPLAVGRILATWHFDQDTIVAGLLHDVIEDTAVNRDEVAAAFGEAVATMVEGVSKLPQLSRIDRLEAQALNFQKMFLAMAKDFRVLFIKLADRLHNMRTMSSMAPASKRRISRETHEVYARVAQRLGMTKVALELDNLAFQHAYPWRYPIVKQFIDQRYAEQQPRLQTIMERFRSRLQDMGIEAVILTPTPHYWRIFNKMRQDIRLKGQFFSHRDDSKIRILVDNVDNCYRVLGLVHRLYRPIANGFRDYIATPKSNDYQSLHTRVIAEGLRPMIQINTQDMHLVAENGIALYWSQAQHDQSTNQSVQAFSKRWFLRNNELRARSGDPMEFYEQFKLGLQPENVFIYSPKGDLYPLPQQATVVDFAYAVHSDVGNRCVGALIEGRNAALDTVLDNGQTVNIITHSNSGPDANWLEFVVTAKARSHIRHHLKTRNQKHAVQTGQSLLQKALHDRQQHSISDKQQTALLRELGFNDLDELFTAIALGQIRPEQAANIILSHKDISTTDTHQQIPLVIDDSKQHIFPFAQCCHPVPNDPITGLIYPGKGISIHRQSCHQVLKSQIKHRFLAQWQPDISGDFLTILQLDVADQTGVMSQVTGAIANANSNIESISSHNRLGMMSTFRFTLHVRNRQHLSQVIRSLRQLSSVYRLQRC